jgi:hypothetical protein
VYLPDGHLRTESKGFEMSTTLVLGLGKEYAPPSQADKLKKLYISELTAPEELRGQGGITLTYMDPSLSPDNTLYLPTVRRMRRLAGSVAKQYFPGSIERYEDISYTQALPDLNYRIVGFKLFNPPDTFTGYEQDYHVNYKRLSDAGDVVAIIEVTPKPGVSWWYAKRFMYCGLMTMAFDYSEEFDANGKLIRRLVDQPITGSQSHLGGPDGPPAFDWWVHWGESDLTDFVGGFVQRGWDDNSGSNVKVSHSFYSAETLQKEPMTIQEWLR